MKKLIIGKDANISPYRRTLSFFAIADLMVEDMEY